MNNNLKIYNTLSRKKEDFKPITNNHVGMYVCGPTVYGDPHLGHARPAIIFDIIFRYFKHNKYKVRYVRNITDVGHLENDSDDGIDKIEKKAQSEKPDLILLDVMMPQMDGFSACKKLKDDLETTNIPVIFISSKAEYFDKIKGYNAGGVDYITKPFEKTEVLIRIKTQLKLKKAMDKLSEYNRWLEKMMNEQSAETGLK